MISVIACGILQKAKGQENKPATTTAQGTTTLSLEVCKKLAITNNYSLKMATSEVTQSAELKKSAFTSYFPKVNAGFSAVKMNDYLIKSSIPQMNLPVYDGNPANLPLATEFAYFPGMTLNMLDYVNIGYVMAAQPLFTGGRIYNGNRLAKTGYEISCEKKLLTETEVLVKTEELYWNILALSEKLSTINSYGELLNSLNRDVTVALEAGVVQRTDLLKVQLKQNELEANRLKLKDGITLSKKALCQHIGVPYDSTLLLTDTIAVIRNPGTLFTDPSDAVKSRNEYKILEKAGEAEVLQKKLVMGEYLPQLAIGVAGVYTDVMDKTDEMGVAFATLSVPISDWWGGSHKIRQSKAKIEMAHNRLNETTELLTLQITQAQFELNQYYVNIGIAEKSLQQASENLKVTRDNYTAGITGMSDLLEAQSVHQQALNSLTESKCNYQVALANYMQAINMYK